LSVLPALLPSPLVELHDDRLARRGVRLWLKRDDLISPLLPGNKYRKLVLNLAAAAQQGRRTLLTFGGAYSNHLRAVAAAGHALGLRTIGVVRGEPHTELNPSLAQCVRHGMRLHYLDRASYRDKHLPASLHRMRAEYGDFYLIPEGGSNALAVRGCAAIAAEIPIPYDMICCPVGTGGTLAGLALGASVSSSPDSQAVGFAVLRGVGLDGRPSLADEVAELQRQAGLVSDNWRLEPGFHCGGYARRDAVLDGFLDDFAARHGDRLDWVYVGKMMLGVFTMVERGELDGRRVVAVVTG
jgi:1-aminocyclopropane-1-carboxylate deaminase